MASKVEYAAIPDDETDSQSSCSTNKGRVTIQYSTLVILIVSNILSLCAGLFLANHLQTTSDPDIRHSSAPSPLLDQINLNLHDEWFNHTLFQTNASIFTQRPSPAVDAAWERYGSEYTVPFSSSEIQSIGKDPSLVVDYPSDWAVDNDSKMTMIEVFHQIHCLNSMRRAANYNHYYRAKLGDTPPDFFWTHLGHCQWVLLQSIMCSADVGLITFNWVQGEEYPFPDFNTQHKCRDFNSILDWQEKHQVDMTKGDWANLTRPNDAVVLDAKGRSKPW